MSKFDGLSKLELQDALRQLEPIPAEFCWEERHEIQSRLDRIRETEKQSDTARDERRHREMIEHAQKELDTSVAQHRESLAHVRRSSWVAATIAVVAAVASLWPLVFPRVAPLSAPAALPA